MESHPPQSLFAEEEEAEHPKLGPKVRIKKTSVTRSMLEVLYRERPERSKHVSTLLINNV